MTPLLTATAAALALLIAAALVLRRWIGFSAQRPADYTQGPDLDLRRHLNGPILCEGVIYGPLGRVTSRFVAQMQGEWDGNQGVLREDFRYDSGAAQRREWRLSVGNDGTIRALADDVVGTGTGRVSGGAVQLRYRLRLPAAAGGHVLDVNDWMYLTPSGALMNRSQFRKFGFKVAELVATLRPAPHRADFIADFSAEAAE